VQFRENREIWIFGVLSYKQFGLHDNHPSLEKREKSVLDKQIEITQ